MSQGCGWGDSWKWSGDGNDYDGQDDDQDDGQSPGDGWADEQWMDEEEDDDNSSKPSWWNSAEHWQHKTWAEDDGLKKGQKPGRKDGQKPGQKPGQKDGEKQGEGGKKNPYNFAKYRRTIKRETQRECEFQAEQKRKKLVEQHAAETAALKDSHEKEMNAATQDFLRREAELGDRLQRQGEEIMEHLDRIEAMKLELSQQQREITRLTMAAASTGSKVESLQRELEQESARGARLDERLAEAERLKRRYDFAIAKWQKKVNDLKDQIEVLKVGSWEKLAFSVHKLWR